MFKENRFIYQGGSGGESFEVKVSGGKSGGLDFGLGSESKKKSEPESKEFKDLSPEDQAKYNQEVARQQEGIDEYNEGVTRQDKISEANNEVTNLITTINDAISAEGRKTKVLGGSFDENDLDADAVDDTSILAKFNKAKPEINKAFKTGTIQTLEITQSGDIDGDLLNKSPEYFGGLSQKEFAAIEKALNNGVEAVTNFAEEVEQSGYMAELQDNDTDDL